jgi:hypothetical protein
MVIERVRYPKDYSHAETTEPVIREYRLFDPETGQNQTVRGDFFPLLEQEHRPLQSAELKTVFWAARNDEKTHVTEIGKYDTAHFKFMPVMKVPTLQFGSTDFWVDEKHQCVYLAYHGHLLRVLFPGKV